MKLAAPLLAALACSALLLGCIQPGLPQIWPTPTPTPHPLRQIAEQTQLVTETGQVVTVRPNATILVVTGSRNTVHAENATGLQLIMASGAGNKIYAPPGFAGRIMDSEAGNQVIR